MRLSSFLGLVEIQTKIASVIPFLLGTAFALYRFEEFNYITFFIFFLSMITFDMLTTALNNYFDYKRANKKHGYNYESHNKIVRDNLGETTVIITMSILFIIAVLSGILLVYYTNIVVLLIGMISFAIGILYSFGPLPISRTPLGEIFSGLFMGFVIVFLSVYVHVFDLNIVSIAYQNGMLNVEINIVEVIFIFFVSIPTIICIANVMLANNICDIEDDIENRRYTLPVFIGKQNAVKLFRYLYYAVYINIIVLVILKVVPFICLLTLLTFIPVYKNLNIFSAKQTKKDTFIIAIKNFVLICISYILLMVVAIAINFLISVV